MNYIPTLNQVAILLMAFVSLMHAQPSSQKQFLREQESEIVRILGFKTQDSLKLYFRSLPTRDQNLSVIFASKCMEFQKNKGNERQILGTMPQSKIEASYFYEMCRSPLGTKQYDEQLNAIACGYYEIVARALLHNKRYVSNFFRLGFVIEGEIAEIYATWCSWLVEQDCVWFFNSLGQTHPAIEEAILGLLDLDPPNATCMAKKKSLIARKYLTHFGVK